MLTAQYNAEWLCKIPQEAKEVLPAVLIFAQIMFYNTK